MPRKFSDIPCTIEAIYKVPTFGWLQVFALAGAIEAKNQARAGVRDEGIMILLGFYRAFSRGFYNVRVL